MQCTEMEEKIAEFEIHRHSQSSHLSEFTVYIYIYDITEGLNSQILPYKIISFIKSIISDQVKFCHYLTFAVELPPSLPPPPPPPPPPPSPAW